MLFHPRCSFLLAGLLALALLFASPASARSPVPLHPRFGRDRMSANVAGDSSPPVLPKRSAGGCPASFTSDYLSSSTSYTLYLPSIVTGALVLGYDWNSEVSTLYNVSWLDASEWTPFQPEFAAGCAFVAEVVHFSAFFNLFYLAGFSSTNRQQVNIAFSTDGIHYQCSSVPQVFEYFTYQFMDYRGALYALGENGATLRTRDGRHFEVSEFDPTNRYMFRGYSSFESSFNSFFVNQYYYGTSNNVMGQFLASQYSPSVDEQFSTLQLKFRDTDVPMLIKDVVPIEDNLFFSFIGWNPTKNTFYATFTDNEYNVLDQQAIGTSIAVFVYPTSQGWAHYLVNEGSNTTVFALNTANNGGQWKFAYEPTAFANIAPPTAVQSIVSFNPTLAFGSYMIGSNITGSVPFCATINGNTWEPIVAQREQ